ncbi:hypothetical protein [Saccharopolyspora rosea]|uniref:Luciferase-like monooxygenase n=1 Tax=Saccharopolyspora rosea TaxID=524884 RepID=A0ABW3FPI2_9PSEU|nr:hypothetical protein [Saccharopolyspora rosea]
MRRHVVGYCFPWDVDEGFAVRAVELGVDEVAIATAHRSTRAATPW